MVVSYRRKIIVFGIGVSLAIAAVSIYFAVSRQAEESTIPADAENITAEISNLDDELKKSDGADARMSLLSTKIETYKSVGKYDEALEIAQQLEREFPDNASYKADIARIYELKGDTVNAVSYWRQAIDELQKRPQNDESAAEKSYYEERLSFAEGGR